MLVSWIVATWYLVEASAPWLLLGFFIAGLVHVLLPRSFVHKNLAKPGFFSVLRASLLGIPLPLCSCSVIPVGVSLRRAGASRGATASFFVSTPEIGIDSTILSYALLGPILTIVRVIAAFFSAIGAGVLIDRKASNESLELEADSTAKFPLSKGSCCVEEAAASVDLGPSRNNPRNNLYGKLREVLKYGYGDMVDDLSFALAVGLLLAGLVSSILPDSFFVDLGLGFFSSTFLMLMISLPVYVCATSLTPLAAALLFKGMAPGAVLIFLLVGPATNISTMLAVKQELGLVALKRYLAAIIVVSSIFALIVEFGFGDKIMAYVSSNLQHNHLGGGLYGTFAGFLLVGLLIKSFSRKYLQKS